MTQWEYTTVIPASQEILGEFLTRYGDQFWELAAVFETAKGKAFTFKRPKGHYPPVTEFPHYISDPMV